MKLHSSSMEVPFRISHKLMHKTPKIIFIVSFFLILLTVIPLCYPLYSLQIIFSRSSPPPPSSYVSDEESAKFGGFSKRRCDIFSGEWVPNPKAPYYTNSTCWAIHEYQNCMKHGRPDTEFMKWRWKPDDCELPIFDPSQFLEIVRGKSLAFVGDSVARNQMQSLMCLLSKVEYPIEVSYTKRWNYTTYNFTLAIFWTPYLVKTQETSLDGSNNTGLFNLYLDEYDESWTSQIENFDYIIISAGHWFFRPSMYYQKRRLVGCQFCLKQNVTALPTSYGYRRAFRTSFRAINSLKDYKGTTFLRTFSPSHFENGVWNMGGNCVRQRPFKSNETRLESTHLELYMVQLEEYKKAEKEGAKRGLKYMLLDTTQAMLLRPDGHPSIYGHWTNENVKLVNDCLHWCLPGPIDTWNDFLLEMLKVEKVRRQMG